MRNLEAFVGISDRTEVPMIPDEACNVSRAQRKKMLLSASVLHGRGVERLPASIGPRRAPIPWAGACCHGRKIRTEKCT